MPRSYDSRRNGSGTNEYIALGGRPDSMVRTPASLLLWPAGGILDIREAYRVKFATGLSRETNDVSQTAGDDVGSRLARDRALHITFVPVLHASFPCSHRQAAVQAGMPASELASRSLNSRPAAGLASRRSACSSREALYSAGGCVPPTDETCGLLGWGTVLRSDTDQGAGRTAGDLRSADSRRRSMARMRPSSI